MTFFKHEVTKTPTAKEAPTEEIPEALSSTYTFKESPQEDGTIKVQVFDQDTEVAYATYIRRETWGIHLKWLETHEEYQYRGIGSKILDYFYSKLRLDLEFLFLDTANEEMLNYFIFQWFKKHLDPKDEYAEQVKHFFNTLLLDEDVDALCPTLLIHKYDLKTKICFYELPESNRFDP